MDLSDTLTRWEGYAEILRPLRDEVADIFEVHYIWDYQLQCTEKLYEADEDTVFLLKLSEKLTEICAFVEKHLGILRRRVDIEEEQRANLEQAFEAWKRGLCPLLMRKVQRYVKPDSMDWWETYDEIAKFLTSGRMSYEGTKRAIEAWEASRTQLKLSA